MTITTQNNTQLDETLRTLVRLGPTLQKSFFSDVIISISDLEKVIYQLNPVNSNEVDNTGKILVPEDPMYTVIRTKKEIYINIPKEQYGTALRVTINPIFNEHRQIVGTLAVSRNNNDQANLIKMSDTFTSTTIELNHSASDLTTSANLLANYMNDVQAAQQNLSGQVEDSTKILDMINNVAKNTRILGFNAGIEAARSGEHGKGFAVVAKEITKLADQSSESVIEIRQLLESMKDKVYEVTKTVNDTIYLANNQAETTQTMAQAIEQLSVVSETIEQLAGKL